MMMTSSEVFDRTLYSRDTFLCVIKSTQVKVSGTASRHPAVNHHHYQLTLLLLIIIIISVSVQCSDDFDSHWHLLALSQSVSQSLKHGQLNTTTRISHRRAQVYHFSHLPCSFLVGRPFMIHHHLARTRRLCYHGGLYVCLSARRAAGSRRNLRTNFGGILLYKNLHYISRLDNEYTINYHWE